MSPTDSTINTQEGTVIGLYVYRDLQMFVFIVITNFMTKKQPKDQDKDFPKRVSRRLETKTQVSRITAVYKSYA